jgi:hypothetical protein
LDATQPEVALRLPPANLWDHCLVRDSGNSRRLDPTERMEPIRQAAPVPPPLQIRNPSNTERILNNFFLTADGPTSVTKSTSFAASVSPDNRHRRGLGQNLQASGRCNRRARGGELHLVSMARTAPPKVADSLQRLISAAAENTRAAKRHA